MKFLGKAQVHIGIGTPNRLQALLENGMHVLSLFKWVQTFVFSFCCSIAV